ncbi:hypothetical protein VN12_20985 [Pirellula sp. SH-Sr6A]|uniref:DUF2760 domain-containing protein n=1 Tax=Pirellula sp. SH-Sr6A TaxID=1632865 RepID=UPI00078C9B6A|nr:DUF2760 domain-containing protein [Pirellula sp. SH-Sr6A]AMV34613.1 hypothetical protein VN12_20985 [Pirellula sp. SH-Sr6A]
MRILLAFRAFFAVLLNKERAAAVQKLLLPAPAQPDRGQTPSGSKPTMEPERPLATPKKPAPIAPKSTRSEALTLLSTLQREARLIDLIQESLDQYSDAQIGAAARDVLRDSKKCLQQAFGIKPLLEQSEGEAVSIPDTPSPIRWRLLGSPKTNGRVVHPGWIATQCNLPTWSGNADDSLVLAAAEVET